MVKEFYESIKVDISDKSRNPFIGAFIFVWVIRNWEAVYTFFYFGKDISREERICILNGYFTDYDWKEVGVTVALALLAIVVSYFLLNVTRGIVNAYEKKVTPWVLDLTGYNQIVPIDDHNKMIEANVELERKLKEIKDDRAKMRVEVEELEKRLHTISIENTDEDTNSPEPTLNDDEKPLRKNRQKSGDEALLSKAKKIVNSMPNEDLLDFKDLAGKILFQDTILLSENKAKEFTMIGLFEFVDRAPNHPSYGIFALTDLGEAVLEIINERRYGAKFPSSEI